MRVLAKDNKILVGKEGLGRENWSISDPLSRWGGGGKAERQASLWHL
jgi:hypothetical protein